MVYIHEKNNLREKALKAINETTFYPKKGKDRLLSMVEGRPTGVFQDKESGEYLCQSL